MFEIDKIIPEEDWQHGPVQQVRCSCFGHECLTWSLDVFCPFVGGTRQIAAPLHISDRMGSRQRYSLQVNHIITSCTERTRCESHALLWPPPYCHLRPYTQVGSSAQEWLHIRRVVKELGPEAADMEAELQGEYIVHG